MRKYPCYASNGILIEDIMINQKVIPLELFMKCISSNLYSYWGYNEKYSIELYVLSGTFIESPFPKWLLFYIEKGSC